MFYIYPTHISLHLITSHTAMSYISMSNINTQHTTYIHYFKHTSNFLSFFKFLDRLAPHQKLDPCPLCMSYSGKQVGASFQEVSFLFLVPLTLVIECPATVWNNVGIGTISIDGNLALLTHPRQIPWRKNTKMQWDQPLTISVLAPPQQSTWVVVRFVSFFVMQFNQFLLPLR